ncbi:MAG: LacI family DNA-binding transcriptional regulator [Planctomycetota bacterium]|nr:LacI family DNA-binding transcriptional regulator [Planctomycetota bacterium]
MSRSKKTVDPKQLNGPELLERIAAEVGVSTRTVYRVLNQRSGEVWASAASRGDRIRALAQEWGYRPNLAARTTRTGRFGSISLVMGMGPNSTNFPLSFIKGLHDGLANCGFSLQVSRVHDDQLADVEVLPSYLGSQQVDGLVIYYDQPLPAHAEEALAASRLPHIWVNLKRQQNCIHYDDRGAGRLAVETLLALGHRRIAYLRRSGGRHHSSADRLQGYRAGMRAAGLEPILIEPFAGLSAEESDVSRFVMSDRLTTLFAALDPWPTAMIGYSADDMLAAYIAALRLGRQVPRDLSLIGIHQGLDTPAGMPLSLVASEAYGLGIEAGHLAAAQVADPATPLKPHRQPYAFRPRGTHGPGPA